MCDTHIQSCAKPSLIQVHIFCVQLTEVSRHIFKVFISASISIWVISYLSADVSGREGVCSIPKSLSPLFLCPMYTWIIPFAVSSPDHTVPMTQLLLHWAQPKADLCSPWLFCFIATAMFHRASLASCRGSCGEGFPKWHLMNNWDQRSDSWRVCQQCYTVPLCSCFQRFQGLL